MMSSVVRVPSIFLLWHPVRIILISKSACGSKKATHGYHTFNPATKRRKNTELLSSSPECLSDSFPSHSVGKCLLLWLAFEWDWDYCYASQSRLSRSELRINAGIWHERFSFSLLFFILFLVWRMCICACFCVRPGVHMWSSEDSISC